MDENYAKYLERQYGQKVAEMYRKVSTPKQDHKPFPKCAKCGQIFTHMRKTNYCSKQCEMKEWSKTLCGKKPKKSKKSEK